MLASRPTECTHFCREEIARLAHELCSSMATIQICLSMLLEEQPNHKLSVMNEALQKIRDIFHVMSNRGASRY